MTNLPTLTPRRQADPAGGPPMSWTHRLPLIGFLFRPEPPVPDTIVVSREDWIRQARMVERLESDLEKARAAAIAAQRERFVVKDELEKLREKYRGCVEARRYNEVHAQNVILVNQLKQVRAAAGRVA